MLLQNSLEPTKYAHLHLTYIRQKEFYIIITIMGRTIFLSHIVIYLYFSPIFSKNIKKKSQRGQSDKNSKYLAIYRQNSEIIYFIVFHINMEKYAILAFFSVGWFKSITVLFFLLFYNALNLNNQKILCLPSIFQFGRKLGF